MQRKWLLTSLSALALWTGARAQKINTDSLSLVSKISADQLKLAKLQNQIEEKTRDKQDAAEQAQKSASENAEAANKLSSNPQDQKLARRADQSASDARSDARKARKAADRLDDLNKNIQDLKDRIARENSQLGRYMPPAAAPVGTPGAAPAVTTHPLTRRSSAPTYAAGLYSSGDRSAQRKPAISPSTIA